MKVACSVDPASCCRYYANQGGSGIDIYRSYPVQRGSGLGSVLGGLFRAAIPALRGVVKSVAPHILRTGVKVVGDVANGQSFGHSIKDRTLETVSDALLRAAEGNVLKGSNKRHRGRAGNGIRQPRRKRHRREAY